MTFEEHMRKTLGEDYDAWEALQQDPPIRGIRVNLLKCSIENLQSLLDEPFFPSPFCSSGLLLEPTSMLNGNHPLHHAGAFYFQEPSATAAVTALAPAPGERILDLCAAPGGKSTQIASALQGRGLLWSNEIIRSRAKILLSNVERMGIHNAVVSSAHPEDLCRELSGFFDKVLVDAPCSGEGMMRRDPLIRPAWNMENVLACADRQKKLLESAALAVKERGLLVYSTCTFSGEENEQVISDFLSRNPDFYLEPIAADFGRPAYERLAPECSNPISTARRILPQDGGEGHFVACMRRTSPNAWNGEYFMPNAPEDRESALVEQCCASFLRSVPDRKTMHKQGTDVLFLPAEIPAGRGLGILRAGIQAGTFCGARFEPAHALFAAFGSAFLRKALDLDRRDPRLRQFLHGEELPCGEESGYLPVLVNGIPVGFGKASGGRLKNHYPKGLRIV